MMLNQENIEKIGAKVLLFFIKKIFISNSNLINIKYTKKKTSNQQHLI